ncbi:MAG: peptidylglycine alpha-amidating monooxygenase [Deltaproteobacteria bacterium]|nr:peptidylglycine alpha-amidating monooxygenase [Deltaproteobacteria bacterium]
MRVVLGVGLASLLAIGCGSKVTNEAATPTSDGGAIQTTDAAVADRLPCDVDAVLANECRTCHGSTPSFGAPMSLVTLADLQKPSPSDPSKKTWEEVKRRVNLPADSPERMPQAPNHPLTAADLATLNAWFSAGAPGSSETCMPADGGHPPPKPLSCTPDVQLRPKTKWTMPKDRHDVYACYGVELDSAVKKHVIAVEPKILNTKIVHHILLMQSDAPVDGTPFPCGAGTIARYRMLYGWAPGVGSFELPKEAGLPAGPGKTYFVVQIHYNNLTALEGETDDSGFDLCSTSELRPNDADVMAFGSMKFAIPPMSTHDITASWTLPGSVGELHAIGAFPHMHQLGRSITTTLHPASGGTIDLGSAPGFDFENQFFAPLPSVAMKSGDTVRTRCVWKNDGKTAVSYGEDTAEEMCFSFTMYYPKITFSPWSWAAPAYLSSTTVN